ncbi:MAG: hypothetical protein JXQ73_28340 [Phycisphaerae bacterium]|nr:hypothetical protein [Phycisphaerae bacterium]
MDRFYSALERFTSSPFVLFGVSIIILVTSINEARETFWSDLRHAHMRAHHGLIVFGFFNLLRSLPDMHEAMERMAAARKE